MEENDKSLKDIIRLGFLDPVNSSFSMSENGFLMLCRKPTEKPETETVSESGSEPKADVKSNESTEERVILHRAFPFDKPDEYISVLNEKQEEIGLIKSLGDFNAETQAVLHAELDKKYFVFFINSIESVKERFGYSYWICESDCGKIRFTLRDTFRSIVKITPDRIFMQDVDGCRYELKSLAALDAKSFHKIELYI
ncbi:hypothetical protein SDC9_115106 [bioreactor metagenome]|uniref:DUF1854 domain-containing protein n=1 Tax=bioreactor metagenome TaxID=1076179 RepID=A0A645BS70_9ZZZZ